MSSSPTRRHPGLRPLVAWAAVATVSMGVLFGHSSAFAAAPPANTVIGNQASASYRDPNGLAQTSTSNLVQTTVQQVGSFALDGINQVTTTVVNSKTGAAGATLYAPHVITNTGNGADGFAITVATPAGGFTAVEVYADANSDGQPDGPALCSVASGAACTVPAQTIAGSNGEFKFVVAYKIPSTATTPTTPFSTGTVTVTPSTAALYTAPNTVAADVDNINLTTLAAFNVTKGLAAPASGIGAPGGGAWPAVASSGQRSSSASCATTWTAGMTSSASCQYTVYTLTYGNTGGASGRFNLQDTIGTGATAGMTYVAGSAVWSNAPGTALGDGAGGDPSGVDFQAAGNVLTFVDQSLPPSTTRTVSFVVLVNSTAAVGTSTTSNRATFNPLDAVGATAAAPVSVTAAATNFASFTVTGTYAIALGSASSTNVTAVDTVAGTPNGTGTAGADTTVLPSVIAGQAAAFSQVVYNNGNDTDAVNLAAVSPGTATGTAFPAGTTFTFYRADGVTPLADTNGDGIVDTGPLPSGSSMTIVVKAALPNSTAPSAGPLGYTLTVTGTSTGDASKVDATRDVLNSLIGALVDLTNTASGLGTGGSNDDVGAGPSVAPTTIVSVPAGQTTTFALFVKNNDSIGNSYSLAVSSGATFPGSLPAGWIVKFAAAGTTSATCAASAAITSVTVGAGAQQQLTACVTVPVSQVPVTAQPIYFQVRSTAVASTGAVVVDTKYDAVTVTSAALTYSATLTPANIGEVAPGGSVVYAHTLTNTGSGICAGPYTVSATLSAADVTAGWTTALYVDVDGDGVLGAADTLITGPIASTLAVSGTQKLLVKVFAPGGATSGSASQATVTVTFPAGATSCGTPSTTDLSTVVSGQIRLNKTQALDALCDGTPDTAFSAAAIAAAKPGQCVIYNVVAENQGTSIITNLSMTDSVPTWTTLTGAVQPATQCVSTGITPAFTGANYGSTASAVTCGSAANSVNPGGTATLTFSVRINP